MAKKNDVDVSDSLEDLLSPEHPKKERFNTPPKDVNKESQQQTATNTNTSQNTEKTGTLHSTESVDFIDLAPQNTNQNQSPPTSTNKEIKGGLSPNHVDSDGFVHCPPAIIAFKITQKAFDDIIMVAKAINELSQEKFGPDAEKLEVYVYLFADPQDIKPGEPARVSAIYIPYHEASESRVNVNEAGMLDIQKYIRESGKILIGWAHSHGHFEVYSSQTDDINHQIILNETNNFMVIQKFKVKYIYSLTVVDSGDNFPVVLSQYPCGHIEQSKAELDIEGDHYTPEEAEARYNEIKEILRKRATLIRPTQAKSLEEALEDLAEELIGDFIRKLWKAKTLMLEKITPEHEKLIEIIQKYLQDYDKLLVSGAEESFKTIAQKILGFMQKSKENT